MLSGMVLQQWLASKLDIVEPKVNTPRICYKQIKWMEKGI